MAARLQVVVLNAARDGHAVFAVGELQVLDIGPHDGRRTFVGHVDQVLAVVLEQRVFVVTLLLGAFAHDQRLDAARGRGLGRIDMDRNEEVAAGLVGDVGARLQVFRLVGSQRLVRLARIDHLHAGHALLDHFAELESHLQRQVLFAGSAVVRTGIVAAVTGVDHHNFDSVRNIPGRCRVRKNGYGRKCE